MGWKSKLILPFLTFVGQNAFEAFLKLLLLYIISSCMNRSCLSWFMELSNSDWNKQWCIGSWLRSGTVISKVGRGWRERQIIFYIYTICIFNIYIHTQFYTDTAAFVWRICGSLKSFLLYRSENEYETYEYKEIALEIQPCILHRCTEYSAS